MECSGYLARAIARLLMCSPRATGRFDRSPPRASRVLRKVVLCFTHLLPCRFFRLSPSGYGFPLPYLVVFCLSLPASFCLAVNPVPAICLAARHTRRRRQTGDGEGELKTNITARGKYGEDADSLHPGEVFFF